MKEGGISLLFSMPKVASYVKKCCIEVAEKKWY